jgi:hypothetical protein
MKQDDLCMYVFAAQREFEWLCGQIIHDGRDPGLIALVMTDKLVRRVRELNDLWNNRYTAEVRG